MVQDVAVIPDCPACGCSDSRIIKHPAIDSWFPSGTAVCNFCEAEYQFGPEDTPKESPKPKTNGVQYFRVRCPVCRERGAPTVHTDRLKRGDGTVWGIRRQHKCKCGHCFKSMEDL